MDISKPGCNRTIDFYFFHILAKDSHLLSPALESSATQTCID